VSGEAPVASSYHDDELRAPDRTSSTIAP
jgi:hypothetical protein